MTSESDEFIIEDSDESLLDIKEVGFDVYVFHSTLLSC